MDFKELYGELDRVKTGIIKGAEEGLKLSAEIVADAARAKPGAYQPGVGPYAAWPKLKKGQSPLLKSGTLRAAIAREGTGSRQLVGVSGYGALHETGTSKIPQRAFLGPSVLENQESIIKTVADSIESELMK